MTNNYKYLIWLCLGCIAIFLLGVTNESLAQSPDSNDIVLVVESTGFTPVGYQAIPEITPGNVARIIAVGGGILDYYEWQVNNRTIKEYSGIGQNVLELSITDQPIGATVVVYQGNNVVGTESTTIKPQPVDLVIYQDHPTKGPLYHNALSGLIRTTAVAMNLIAVPYGADSDNPATTWRIGKSGQLAPTISIQPESLGPQSISASFKGSIFSKPQTQTVEVQFATPN